MYEAMFAGRNRTVVEVPAPRSLIEPEDRIAR